MLQLRVLGELGRGQHAHAAAVCRREVLRALRRPLGAARRGSGDQSSGDEAEDARGRGKSGKKGRRKKRDDDDDDDGGGKDDEPDDDRRRDDEDDDDEDDDDEADEEDRKSVV